MSYDRRLDIDTRLGLAIGRLAPLARRIRPYTRKWDWILLCMIIWGLILHAVFS